MSGNDDAMSAGVGTSAWRHRHAPAPGTQKSPPARSGGARPPPSPTAVPGAGERRVRNLDSKSAAAASAFYTRATFTERTYAHGFEAAVAPPARGAVEHLPAAGSGLGAGRLQAQRIRAVARRQRRAGQG